MLPIFDALSHPTITGNWFSKPANASVEVLVKDMELNGFHRALAVGLPGVEGYSHEAFLAACAPFEQLIPIAGFDTGNPDFSAEIRRIKEMGFAGIKIHPRISNLDYEHNQIRNIIHECGNHQLVVLYCTYAHCSLNQYPAKDPLYYLIDFLRGNDHTKVILMHGGDVQLLKYAELVRFNSNLLLDLSMTIMKYKGSSVDDDIRFLFSQFDRRICIGTDHPEYTHEQIRKRFEQFCSDTNISEEKMSNIAHRNLEYFFGINTATI